MTNTHSHSIFLRSNIYCYCKRCLKGKTMRKKWKMQYCLIFTKLIRQILSFLWVSLKFRRLKPFSHQKKYLQFSNYKKETYILTYKLVTTILAFFFKPLTLFQKLCFVRNDMVTLNETFLFIVFWKDVDAYVLIHSFIDTCSLGSIYLTHFSSLFQFLASENVRPFQWVEKSNTELKWV